MAEWMPCKGRGGTLGSSQRPAFQLGATTQMAGLHSGHHRELLTPEAAGAPCNGRAKGTGCGKEEAINYPTVSFPPMAGEGQWGQESGSGPSLAILLSPARSAALPEGYVGRAMQAPSAPYPPPGKGCPPRGIPALAELVFPPLGGGLCGRQGQGIS